MSRKHRAKENLTRKVYSGLVDIWIDLAQLLQPPERMTVTQASEKYIRLNNPGSYIGPYKSSVAPYMQEPADCLNSREYNGVVFCGSAQSGKTEALCLGWVAYCVKVDPMDLIIYSPTQSAGRDFSMRRVDRLHRNSPDIGGMLLKNRDSDNKFDKHYKTGMMLTLSWPTPTEFAGKPIGRVALTDYDRMDDDIAGDGNPYDLGSMRTTSFKSFAMTLAESSPSRPIEDPKWIKKTAHEAPPCKGILGLYNRGDRRRFYWPCPNCGSYFEGRWSMIQWETKATILESGETAHMVAPCCGYRIKQDERFYMNTWGIWLRDGESIDPETGRKVGRGVRSTIASFWMFGVAAAFTTWTNLVVIYLNAVESFEKTGSEEELKKFFNTNIAEPYKPKAVEVQRLPEILKSLAETLPYEEITEVIRIDRPTAKGKAIEPLVPDNVRFLIGAVDVQQNMFVVQVHGILPGEPFDVVVIDRFSIKKSQRVDHMGESLWVKPGTYLEDWEEVTSEVIKRTYKLSDGTGRRMAIRFTVCDSGGASKTTVNAYNFYRKLREDGEAKRFHLVKGDPLASRPRTMITYPDSNQRSKLAAARGDVPVMLLNSNQLKDTLVNRLECVVPGKGMFRYPEWLPDWWFAEMCAEQRTDKGWEAPNHRRNEGFDLSYYCLAACFSELLRVERIDWSNPPTWATPWDTNTLISKANSPTKEVFAFRQEAVYDFAKFGKTLA